MSASRLPGRLVLIALFFGATYALTHAMAAPAIALPAPALESLPLQLAEWRGMDAPPLDPEVAEGLAATEYVRRYYASSQGVLEMDVAYYAQPRVGTTMHSPLNCLPGTGWEVTSVSTRPVTTSAGTWGVRELIAERGASRYALTYWYQGRDRVLADEVSARVRLLADSLWRRPTDTGLVRVMMPVTGSGLAERDAIAGFSTRLIPELAARLR